MKFGKDIEIKAKLIDEALHGIILEFEFRGIHDHSPPYWNEITEYVKQEADKYKPDALVLDYSRYQYEYGNELMATIFPPAWNSQDNSIRPVAIVACGSTAESIESLVVDSNIRWVFSIEMFSNKETAQGHLKDLLSRPPNG
jgi:hypothetical protein